METSKIPGTDGMLNVIVESRLLELSQSYCWSYVSTTQWKTMTVTRITVTVTVTVTVRNSD